MTSAALKKSLCLKTYLPQILTQAIQHHVVYLGQFYLQLCIMQTPDQLVFTYIDTKGNVNSPLHVDYLNNKMNVIHAPKLRHTGATLARQAGMSLEGISEPLTHSSTITTKTYVNTSNVVALSASTRLSTYSKQIG